MSDSLNIYSGPGQLVFPIIGGTGGQAFQADQAAGEINATVDVETVERHNANSGYVGQVLKDIKGKISTTPFDQWALLPLLFPKYLGVTTGSNTGALMAGTRPHDEAAGSVNGLAAAKIYAYDGACYSFLRAAVTRPPNMKFGVGQSLYGPMEMSLLGDPSVQPGTETLDTFLMGATAAASTNVVAATDFINGHWTAAWGSVTGFTALEVEDCWELVSDVKFNEVKVQGLTRHMQFVSAQFMIKGRLQGPKATELQAKLLGLSLGQIMQEATATDLLLSGPFSKTVTLKNCEIKGGGFSFGGSKLRFNEVGFVSAVSFGAASLLAGAGTAGGPNPSLVFSS